MKQNKTKSTTHQVREKSASDQHVSYQPHAGQQQLLQTIKQSAVVQQAKALQHKLTSSATAEQQRNQVAQLRIDVGTVNKTPKGNRAGVVEVEDVRGETYGEGHNNPSISNVFGWQQLHGAGHTLGNQNSTHYNAVRMHLWNGRLNGPGNKKWNLAPGPATTNSSMSAGPETAAKNAVDNNLRIWFKTEVWYQNNGNSANDFRNVVPNRMKMEWGHMHTSYNTAASRYYHNSIDAPHHKGPARPPAWDEAIDQPAGALSNNAVQAYQNLHPTDTAGLVNMLTNASNQEKVQAFELVANQLKTYIIMHYPEVYYSMGDPMRAHVLTTLPLNSVRALIQNVLQINDDSRTVSEIYYPLVSNGHDLRLQAIFTAFSNDRQKAQIVKGKRELLNHLGTAADAIIMVDYRYFKYLRAADQYTRFTNTFALRRYFLLDTMDSGTVRQHFLSGWAKSRGQTQPSSQVAYIELVLQSSLVSFDHYIKEFKSKMRHHLNNEKRGGRRKSTRRSRKPRRFG